MQVVGTWRKLQCECVATQHKILLRAQVTEMLISVTSLPESGRSGFGSSPLKPSALVLAASLG